MKYTLTFKTPDVMDQVTGYVQSDEDREFIEKFLRWGEYCDIEFDTDAKTATVLKQK